MQKDEFLKKLSSYLKRMTKEELDEIMVEFTEHINYALAKGEDEEKIIERLGDPKKIAKEYRMQKMIEEANRLESFSSMFKAIFASAGLSIVNCLYSICVVAVGYIVIALLYIVVCSIFIGGFGGIVFSIVSSGAYESMVGWLGIFISLALVALSILGFIGTKKLVVVFRRANMQFLNMTRKSIKESISER